MGLFDGVAKGAVRYGWRAETALGVLGGFGSGYWRSGPICGCNRLCFMQYQKNLNLAGVILNRVASPCRERLARLGTDAAGLCSGVLPDAGI